MKASPRWSPFTNIQPGSIEELLTLAQRPTNFTHADLLAQLGNKAAVLEEDEAFVIGDVESAPEQRESIVRMISNQHRTVRHVLEELRASSVRCNPVLANNPAQEVHSGDRFKIENMPGPHYALVIQHQDGLYFFDSSLYRDPLSLVDLISSDNAVFQALPQYESESSVGTKSKPETTLITSKCSSEFLTITQMMPCHFRGQTHTYRQYEYNLSDLTRKDVVEFPEQPAIPSYLLKMDRMILEVLGEDNSLIQVVAPTRIEDFSRITIRKHGGRIYRPHDKKQFNDLLQQVAVTIPLSPDGIIKAMRKAIFEQKKLTAQQPN